MVSFVILTFKKLSHYTPSSYTVCREIETQKPSQIQNTKNLHALPRSRYAIPIAMAIEYLCSYGVIYTWIL